MPFLPIVARELRVASRRPTTYWLRSGAALVAVILATWIVLMPDFATPQKLGLAMFVALSLVGYIFCILAGIRTTADCLSEEKREGTLGLLFLTDLKAYDVILGKLVASSLNVLYGTLAIFPVMAIPLMLGGVTIDEFWRVVVATLNNLFFSLAVGMFVSSVSRDERKAMTVCFLILAGVVVLLPIAGLSIHWDSNRPHPAWFIPSPAYTSFIAFDAPFNSLGFNYYYESLFCTQLLAWLCLGLACWIVPRTWQDKEAKQARGPSWWRQLQGRSPQMNLFIRRHFLDINPILWLTARDRIKFGAVWIALLGGALFWLWYSIKYPNEVREEEGFVFTALAYHTLLKLWIASEAGRRMALDRRSGALELILSTPLSVKSILSGQFMALRQQFLIPALVVLLFDVMFLLASRLDNEMLWIWSAGIIVFIADMVTLAWVGLWMGLTSRNAGRAAGAAVVRIMILPWGVFLGTWVFGRIWLSHQAMSVPDWVDRLSFPYWIALCLGFDFCFAYYARKKLLGSFRALGAQRFDSKQLRQLQKG